MYGNRAKDYRKNEIVTSDPKHLVAICYQAAVLNFKLAKTKYLEKDYEEKANALAKALDIVSELRASLDYERGGQIATNLNALYEYVTRRAIQADTEVDVNGFDEVIHILEELSEAWTIGVIRGEKTVDNNKTGDMQTPQIQPAEAEYKPAMRA